MWPWPGTRQPELLPLPSQPAPRPALSHLTEEVTPCPGRTESVHAPEPGLVRGLHFSLPVLVRGQACWSAVSLSGVCPTREADQCSTDRWQVADGRGMSTSQDP